MSFGKVTPSKVEQLVDGLQNDLEIRRHNSRSYIIPRHSDVTEANPCLFKYTSTDGPLKMQIVEIHADSDVGEESLQD